MESVKEQLEFLKQVNSYKKGGLKESASKEVIEMANRNTLQKIEEMLMLKKEEYNKEQKKVFTDYLNDSIQKNIEERRKKTGFSLGVLQQAMLNESKIKNEKINPKFKKLDEWIEKRVRKILKEETNNSDVKVGDTVKVNMKIISDYDNIPPYIKLVRGVIKDGGGTVYVRDIKDGKAEITSFKENPLGGVFVPVESLKKKINEIDAPNINATTVTLKDKTGKTASLPYNDQKSAEETAKKYKSQGFKDVQVIGKGVIKKI